MKRTPVDEGLVRNNSVGFERRLVAEFFSIAESHTNELTSTPNASDKILNQVSGFKLQFYDFLVRKPALFERYHAPILVNL